MAASPLRQVKLGRSLFSVQGLVCFLLTANVWVNIPVKSIAKAYTYQIPAAFSFLQPGWRVWVPFGGRKVEGFVLEVCEKMNSERNLKEILDVLDEEAWFSAEMIAAARWMADFYLCSLAETMRLFMPGKSGLTIAVSYAAREAGPEALLLQVERYQKIYYLLQEKGPLAKKDLIKELPAYAGEMDALLEKLLQYHLIGKEYTAKKRASARYEKYVLGRADIAEVEPADFSRRPAQKKLLQLLRERREWSWKDLKTEKVSRATIDALAEQGFLTVASRRILRDSYRDLVVKRPEIQLSEDQEKAVEVLTKAIESQNHQEFLLYGVTGSGKTQVYIEAAARVRAKGKNVVVLVPEIALTGQLVAAFKAYFSQDILVMHSRLSLAERNDAIWRIRRGEAGIVVGARSALFTPLQEIGLIILDEEQDMSYKQDEAPRYHARAVAQELARIHQAVLLLGSATPSLETFYRAKQGLMGFLCLPERIGNHPLPEVSCVDMRQELRRGNRKIISAPLRALIEATLAKKEQLILMLNRRGFSTFVMCRSCGYVVHCRFCGLPLVYHRSGRLSCHHCDVQEDVPDVCPKCGSRYIKYFGSGTEKLEAELHELVPSARVIRMDRDTTTGKFSHTHILDRFRNREFDILLGTQMVAKGHDIPSVTAVGIISADSSLNLPDFRAAERCFMLITQTAGRAGRGNLPGHVVVQSYNPEHYAVKAGIQQDYESFYEEEIRLRRELFYPPFSRLVKLTFQDTDEQKALAGANHLRSRFLAVFPKESGQQVLGPAPAAIANFRGTFRFCLLLKCADLSSVRQFLEDEGLQLRTDVLIDIDPLTTL